MKSCDFLLECSVPADPGAGAQEIETRVVELSHLCTSLSAQLQDVTRAVGKSRDSRAIGYLAAQVQTAQDSIASDLALIHLQIMRFESTRPLILT
jgi:hypothetical protein